MSLESLVLKVRAAIEGAEALKPLKSALDAALGAENAAKGAEKRRDAAAVELTSLASEIGKANAALTNAKREAADILDAAKTDAASIRKEAKAKADATVAKSKEKADAMDEATATANEKFAAQKQTNDEILAMANAQIAHAEAKLSEIRAAIAKITGG